MKRLGAVEHELQEVLASGRRAAEARESLQIVGAIRQGNDLLSISGGQTTLAEPLVYRLVTLFHGRDQFRDVEFRIIAEWVFHVSRQHMNQLLIERAGGEVVFRGGLG